MKRLTFDGLFCDIAKCDSTPGGTFCEKGTCTQRRVWERLKEYEDTGLEPEDIKKHESAYNECLTRTYGPFKQKISQWIRAEQDGLLVVLPCKVGDDVWFVRKFGKGQCIKRAKVSCINIDFRGEVFVSARRISGGYIGKTVFLTRKEAEAAMEQEGGPHEDYGCL